MTDRYGAVEVLARNRPPLGLFVVNLAILVLTVMQRINDIVIFRIGLQEFCLDTQEVLEVSRMVPFAVPPQEIEQVAGVVTFRGEVVCVLDLHAALRQPRRVELVEAALLFARVNDTTVGLIVDEVVDVSSVTDQELIKERTPQTTRSALDFASNAIRVNERLIFRLDLERLIPVNQGTFAPMEFRHAASP